MSNSGFHPIRRLDDGLVLARGPKCVFCGTATLVVLEGEKWDADSRGPAGPKAYCPLTATEHGYYGPELHACWKCVYASGMESYDECMGRAVNEFGWVDEENPHAFPAMTWVEVRPTRLNVKGGTLPVSSWLWDFLRNSGPQDTLRVLLLEESPGRGTLDVVDVRCPDGETRSLYDFNIVRLADQECET